MMPPMGTGTIVSPSLRFPPPSAAAPWGYWGRGSQIPAGSFRTPHCRWPPFSSNLIFGKPSAQPSILIPIPRYPGRGAAVVREVSMGAGCPRPRQRAHAA